MESGKNKQEMAVEMKGGNNKPEREEATAQAAMKRGKNKREREEAVGQKCQHPRISAMQPLTIEAYGGGMYGTEEGEPKQRDKPPASDTQSADGPVEATMEPKHKPPPSTGDRGLDITGQSYIQ